MTSILSLPRELRDDIWERVCYYEYPPQQANPSISSRSHGLLRTNRQVFHEATPYMYETTVVTLSHPFQILSWIRSIGLRNSSCIHHLILKFTSLFFEGLKDPCDSLETWSTSLQSLPNLQSLAFHYLPNPDCPERSMDAHEMPVQKIPSDVSQDIPLAEKLETLPKPEALKPRKSTRHQLEIRDLQPDYRFQSITHAVLAINEPMPSILVTYLTKLLKLSSTSSFEQNLTCLPTDFLAELGFYPTRTYALTDGAPSIVFTYRKLDEPPQWPMKAAPSMNLMLSQLPQLSYLRLGCRQLDSSILTAVPLGIKTLDIAFTDLDPVYVATNLRTMRARCGQLFTLTIDVLPLHERGSLQPAPTHAEMRDSEYARELNERTARIVEQNIYWTPFFVACHSLQESGVSVWEGEGLGFRKFAGHGAGRLGWVSLQ